MTAQPPSHDGTFVQITLEGVGFDGAKIPLDSLEDLEEFIDRVTRGDLHPADFCTQQTWSLERALPDCGLRMRCEGPMVV